MKFLKSWASRLLFLTLPFLLIGCESSGDIARKPELVNDIKTESLCKCDLQSEFNQTATYKLRLEEVLMDTKSKTLDFIIDNDITVCLDQRLSNLELGIFDRIPHALYYPAEKTITLYDIGKDYSSKGIFETAASSYSGRLLNEFKCRNEDSLNDTNEIQLGASYMSGKIRVYKWKKDGESYNALKKNPDLLEAPIHACD